MASKDFRGLLKALKDQQDKGFTVRKGKGGTHYIVSKDGKPFTTLSIRSGDFRATKNARAYLRRAGLDI